MEAFLSLQTRKMEEMQNSSSKKKKKKLSTATALITMISSCRASARPLAPSLSRRQQQRQNPAPRRRPGVTPRAGLQPEDAPPPPSSPSSSDAAADDDEVAAAFARHVAALAPAPRAPSPLLSPTTVSRALCSALQRPDSPEVGSGSRVAFDFTLPSDVAPAAPVLAGAGRRARSWGATEAFLGFDAFARDSLAAPPADVFADCESWELVGDLVFTGRGSMSGTGDCSKAAQAVSITAAAGRTTSSSRGGRETEESEKSSGKTRKYTATILLTRVDDAGPWKGCWLVYGMRTGNYCTV